MPNYAILRTKKHSSIGTITASLKHNFREIHTHKYIRTTRIWI